MDILLQTMMHIIFYIIYMLYSIYYDTENRSRVRHVSDLLLACRWYIYIYIYISHFRRNVIKETVTETVPVRNISLVSSLLHRSSWWYTYIYMYIISYFDAINCLPGKYFVRGQFRWQFPLSHFVWNVIYIYICIYITCTLVINLIHVWRAIYSRYRNI